MSLSVDANAKTLPLEMSFLDGITVEFESGNVALCNQGNSLVLRSTSPAQASAFREIERGGRSRNDLCKTVLESDGITGLTCFLANLERCGAAGLIRYSVYENGRPAFSWQPLVPGIPFRTCDLAGRRWILSKFAYIHRRGQDFVLESPLGRSEVLIHDPSVMARVAQVASPCCFAESDPFAQVLGNAACLADAGRSVAKDISDLWEFQDLLFHSRTRAGRHGKRFGGTFRHVGVVDPLPAVKPRVSQQAPIRLASCDLDALQRDDIPFSAVLERRRSHREHGVDPITVGQLGEFLYRAVRVRDIFSMPVPAPDGRAVDLQLSSRPYPAGGAIHELEIYVTAARCDGLEPALYHYDPQGHQLTKLRALDASVEALLAVARRTAGVQRSPDILLTLASRFQRMAWKYETIAYAVTLKNVGALYQTLYLVATAMGLAACGLGNGDSQTFADATGIDYLLEGSVGEFMLGSRP